MGAVRSSETMGTRWHQNPEQRNVLTYENLISVTLQTAVSVTADMKLSACAVDTGCSHNYVIFLINFLNLYLNKML
jgi:hypothetical protein